MDNRAQSVQIGVVLLLGVLLILFSSYQAFVIPQQNKEVEFNHHSSVRDDMKDVRDGILTAGGPGAAEATSVDLGTTYPARLVGVNPPSPSGTLQTEAKGQIHFNNTFATNSACGYSGTTSALVYRPSFTELNAQDIVYDSTAVYLGGPNDPLILSEQTIIQGDAIQLSPLNASISTGGTQQVSLTLRGGPANSDVDTSSAPINITIPTTLSAKTWRTNDKLLADEFVNDSGQVTHVREAQNQADAINVTMKADQYVLTCRAVGINSFPESGQGSPLGAESYGAGGRGIYNENNLQTETLRTQGGKLIGIVNASHLVVEEPEFALVTPSGKQVNSQNERYLQFGLKIENKSIGPDKYERYYLVVGPQNSLYYQLKPDSGNILSFQSAKVSLYRGNTGGDTTVLFAQKELAYDPLRRLVTDDTKLDLLSEENYKSSGAVKSELQELQDFMNNSETTNLVVTNLHGRVDLNVTDEIPQTLGKFTTYSQAIVFEDQNTPYLRYFNPDENNTERRDATGSVTQVTLTNSNPSAAVGPKKADLGAGDEETDIPYKDPNDGHLKAVSGTGENTTLVASDISQVPIGVGDFTDDGNPDVLYANNSGYLAYYAVDDRAAEIIKYNNGSDSNKDEIIGKNNGVQAVAGVAAAPDAAPEGYLDDGSRVIYTNGSTRLCSVGSNGGERKCAEEEINKSQGVSTPADFDNDTKLEVATVNGNNNLVTYDIEADGDLTRNSGQTYASVKGKSIAASDVDGDSTDEIVFISGNNQQLKYISIDGEVKYSGKIKDGNVIKTGGNAGAR